MADDASFAALVARIAEAAPGLLTRALGTGGCWADLFVERTVHHRLSLRQEVGRGGVGPARRSSRRHVVEGAAVRVPGTQREGFAATEDLSALEAAADEAAARQGPRGPARQAAPPARPSIHLELPADAPDAVAEAEKTALLRAAADAALSLDARVRRVEVAYHDRVRQTLVVTSEGVLRAEASMLLGLRVAVTLAAAGGAVTAHAVGGGAFGFGHFFAHPPEALAREAVERTQRLVGAQPPAPGVVPVVLAAGWGGVWLHEAVGHLLEADAVAAGASPLAGCLGSAVAAANVTLADDATLPGGRGACAFDDEGTPAARTTLVENGILRAFLTDRRAASRMSLPPTGNARRQDYRHAPLPRMTNLVLRAGADDPAALLADVADGLYVAAVGHGIARPGHGFAFDVLEGYRIERGRLTAPVTGARLAGTGPEALRALAGVGSDFRLDTARGLCRKAGQVVPVSVGMPTVLLRAMQVGRMEEGGDTPRGLM